MKCWFCFALILLFWSLSLFCEFKIQSILWKRMVQLILRTFKRFMLWLSDIVFCPSFVFCSFSLVDHCFTRNRKNVKLKEIRINSGWISFDCKGQGYNKVVLPLIRFAFRCKPLHFHNFWHVHHSVRSSTIAISCCPFSDTKFRFRR